MGKLGVGGDGGQDCRLRLVIIVIQAKILQK